ncbi:MAG: hypothetical protein LBG76_10605 [Treponema sp.]|nr:hypothetical protein [Treponema sp.]
MMIPEAICGFFLLLPLLRPMVKRLWPLDGLVWLPLFALGITIAIFPAYGFRPECIPLLIYGIIYNVINIPSVLAVTSRLQADDFREQRAPVTLFALALLAAVMFSALYFLPHSDTALLEEGVQNLTVIDESRGEEFFVRVYSSTDTGNTAGAVRPLMILVPPVMGSVGMVDQLCGDLRDRGFTVLTYSHRNFDDPAVDGQGRRFALSVGRRYRWLRIAAQGLVSEKVNAEGRELEEGRRQDLVFLLNTIGQVGKLRDALLPGTDPGCVFAAGYGAGGAALLLLSGSPEFSRRYPAVKGIIAVESPILSVLRGKERPPSEPPRPEGWFRSLVPALRAWAAELGRHKISRITDLPNPAVPVLFLLSDRVWSPRYRDVRYGALLGVLQGAGQPAILASATGAGPLDYSDVPQKYPVFQALFPGIQKSTGKNSLDAAALMTNFAASFLEGTGSRVTIPARESLLEEKISIETGKAWNFPLKGSIL